MTVFKVGDRVRVSDLPARATAAGRKGEVVLVSRAIGGVVYASHVMLDGSLPSAFDEAHAVFGLHELEPE